MFGGELLLSFVACATWMGEASATSAVQYGSRRLRDMCPASVSVHHSFQYPRDKMDNFTGAFTQNPSTLTVSPNRQRSSSILVRQPRFVPHSAVNTSQIAILPPKLLHDLQVLDARLDIVQRHSDSLGETLGMSGVFQG